MTITKKQTNGAIIILGSTNEPSGQLSSIAISRCEKALFEYRNLNTAVLADYKILCTGGFGERFNQTDTAHGKHLQYYLEQRGVPSSAFIEVALSTYTLEDATLAKAIIEKHKIKQVILITSEFHMTRAKLLFNHVFPAVKFTYAEAVTVLPNIEYEKLTQHEKIAIKRDIESIQ
jgi:uncharacterized SAM-binding protein YcdF (DUF218 family)